MVPELIAGMQNNKVAFLKATENFSRGAIAMSQFHDLTPRSACRDGKNTPVVSTTKKRAQRHTQYRLPLPNHNPSFHPIAIAQRHRILSKCRNHIDALLLDAEG